MATNEILPFASTNTGTNLLTQAEYTSDAQRTTGNQPGIARSKLENKVLRQVSLMASGLAQFIASYQANNVTDGLTAQNIADYLLAAITANIPAVPDASTTVKGKVQLATATEAQALADALKALTPSTLNQSMKGGNQSLSSNGYQKLPGGLILQWGYFGRFSSPGQRILITLPIAFPNALITAQGTSFVLDSGTYVGVPEIYYTSTTQIGWQDGDNDSTPWDVYWFAIGY